MNTAVGHALKVLLVENHTDTRELMKLYLDHQGFCVTTAASKAEAAAEASSGTWDILISDIGLPDGSGWELLEEKHFRCPVFAIAMSGYGSANDQRRSTAAGFRRHILKPFDIDALDEALDQAVAEIRKSSAS